MKREIDSNKTIQLKKQLIEAMEKSLGIVTTACKTVGVTRATYYAYYNSDPDFKASIDSLSELTLDFVESALLKRVNEGSDTAIIFFLKTKGKGRGYIEKNQLELSGNSESPVHIYQLPSNGRDKSDNH